MTEQQSQNLILKVDPLSTIWNNKFITQGEKLETVTILCNSGLVTQRSRQQAPRVVVFSISLSSGITEPSQSCSCVYLSHKDLYRNLDFVPNIS